MRIFLCVLGLVAVIALSGCGTYAVAPVIGGLTIDVRGPVAVGDTTAAATRVGVARAEGIVIVSWGDASIEAATRSAGITRIHHVDSKSLNVLGIYARYETIVYGQ